MNRGTKEGDLEEINIVRKINKDELKNFVQHFSSVKKIYGILVRTKVYSNISKVKAKPKSDVFLTEGLIKEDLLEKKDYIIYDDEITSLKLKIIPKSGLSVKLEDSKNYQIAKITKDSFIKVFTFKELGLGASFYCKNIEELKKNQQLLKIWDCSQKEIINFFQNKINFNINNLFHENENSLISFSKIKTFSNNEIKNIIQKNENISNYIFNGKGIFEDPYCAYWIYESGAIKNNVPYNFSVTTGSARLKNPTIVIKPKA
jgi:hypothetical protein